MLDWASFYKWQHKAIILLLMLYTMFFKRNLSYSADTFQLLYWKVTKCCIIYVQIPKI